MSDRQLHLALHREFALALGEVGCPPRTAERLADRLTLREESTEAFVGLFGTEIGIKGESATSVEDWREPLRALAEDVAADNAEAHGRTAAGQRGYEALWPLPTRVDPAS